MKVANVVFEDPIRASAIAVLTCGLFAYLAWLGAGIATAVSAAVAVLLATVAIWANDVRRNVVVSRKAQKKDTFDWGMHYMRGFAIVCIMLMHVQSKLGYHAFTQAFFSSSTVYFLFISGYLCQYLALKKPIQDRIYYRKKY